SLLVEFARQRSRRISMAWCDNISRGFRSRLGGAPEGRAMRTISRRTLMKMMGAGAVALGTPFGKISKAFAAREKEMTILCWEGYNSARVLDPFRKKEGATVKAESLTNDPTMINRVRAGENNVWDLINVNNPWASNMTKSLEFQCH